MRVSGVKLTREQLESYDTAGFLLVRRALPPEFVRELHIAALSAFPGAARRAFWNENGKWALKGHNAWMDVDVFADFVFHRDAPLGALAAQLLGARRVRLSGECLNAVSPKRSGSCWHIDFDWNASHSPRSMPLVRLFLPLHAIAANDTGGSLVVAPLERPPVQFGADTGGTARLEERAFTPSFAPGDVLLYSPRLPHRTQQVFRGKRVGYLVSLFDPERLLPYVHTQPEVFDPHGTEQSELMAALLRNPFGLHPVSGWGSAECWDDLNREYHYGRWWTSAFTQFISNGTSACYPQVFPMPLEHEIDARRRGQVKNTKGPSRTFADWLCNCFPVLRKAAMATWLYYLRLRSGR